MSKEVKHIVLLLVLIGGFLGTLCVGVALSSADMNVREQCYKAGVENLPQGLDQTFLQTQSKAYKECLATN